MEGKHTLESKAKAINQSECTVKSHMDQRAHQDMQLTSDSTKPYTKDPRAHLPATQQRLRSEGPSLVRRNQVVRPNQGQLHRLNPCTWSFLIGSQWRFQVPLLNCRLRDPCATPINMREGGRNEDTPQVALSQVPLLLSA
jgi:hypothetical protein